MTALVQALVFAGCVCLGTFTHATVECQAPRLVVPLPAPPPPPTPPAAPVPT